MIGPTPSPRAEGGKKLSVNHSIAPHLRVIVHVVVFVTGFVASSFLLKAYTGGDHTAYASYYGAIADTDLRQAYRMQFDYTGSHEPFYPLVSWIGSRLDIERSAYFSFFNAVLLTALVALAVRLRAGIGFILLLLSNYYVIVLMTGAERLKFGYLFFLLALLTSGFARWALLTLAPLAHFQSLLNYASAAAARARLSIRRDALLPVLAGIAVAGAAIASFLPAVLAKLRAYAMASTGVTELYQIGLLLVVGIVVLRHRRNYLFSMIPLAAGIYFLGGSRINMVAFSMFIYFTMAERKTRHPLVLIVMLYLSWKSIPFVANILAHGNGFYQ